jgi:hypothetical protein
MEGVAIARPMETWRRSLNLFRKTRRALILMVRINSEPGVKIDFKD